MRRRDAVAGAAPDETSRALAVLAARHRQLLAGGRPEDPDDLTDLLTRLLTGPGDARLPGAETVDWSRVSPTIFGSVRQLLRPDADRRPLGEHYTSAQNVRRTLDPLLLDGLRGELAAASDDPAALHRLWDRLAAVRLLDPACGCGNFLIIGYQDLRAIEADLIEGLERLGGHPGPPRVRLSQLHGIEIDGHSARLAGTALAVLGWRHGDDSRATIVTGCALELDWAALLPPGHNVVVAGNPPYLGHKERTVAQGRQLRAAWGATPVRHLDYATGWFAKALAYFGSIAGRWAFVVTNSVVQGESVPALFQPIFTAGWRITFAHRTFVWTAGTGSAQGQAAVHVVIVGFGRDPGPARLYDGAIGRIAGAINGYLVDGPDVLVQPRRTPLSRQLPAIRAGSTGIDWNQLTVAPEQLAAVREDPVAARYLRRFVGGRELINDMPRWCLWMAGPDFDPADLHRSPLLRHRVELVRAHRTRAGRPATRRLADTPHLFGEIRQPTGTYLAMPQTFTQARSHATAARLDAEVIASVKLFTAPDPDGLLFALFSSAMFLTWQRTVGGRLKSDPSFSASLVWNTLPLPPLAPAQRAGIVAAGATILAARVAGASLAHQYSPGRMATPLLAAHAELDLLVDMAFGAVVGCRDDSDRQRLLFARYADLT